MSTDANRRAEATAGESAADPDVGIERKLIVGTLVGVVVGSILPWTTIMGETVYGVEGAGLMTLALAVATGVAAYYYEWDERAMLAALGGGAVIATLALTVVGDAAAVGVYVTLCFGLALGGAGASGYRKRR